MVPESGLLHTLVLLSSLSDSDSDYIEAQIPLLLSVLPTDFDWVTVDDHVQAQIYSRYGLKIPLHVLEQTVHRARKRDLVVPGPEKGEIGISRSGMLYVSLLPDLKTIERNVAEVCSHAVTYLESQHAIALSESEAEDLLRRFIVQHTPDLRSFMEPGSEIEPVVEAVPLGTRESRAVSGFFAFVEHSDPRIASLVRDFVKGSLLCAALYSKSPAHFTSKFRDSRVFLDTNILFPLLGYDHEPACRAARELAILVKEAPGLRLSVLDVTVDEAAAKLRHFEHEYRSYVPNVPVDSLYSALIEKGMTPSKVILAIADLDNTIREHGIELVSTNYRLEEYSPSDARLFAAIKSAKPDKPAASINHDVIAVEYVRRLRRGRIRVLESARAIIASADARLFRTLDRYYGHWERGTYSEVVLDRILASILWMKSPQIAYYDESEHRFRAIRARA